MLEKEGDQQPAYPAVAIRAAGIKGLDSLAPYRSDLQTPGHSALHVEAPLFSRALIAETITNAQTPKC